MRRYWRSILICLVLGAALSLALARSFIGRGNWQSPLPNSNNTFITGRTAVATSDAWLAWRLNMPGYIVVHSGPVDDAVTAEIYDNRGIVHRSDLHPYWSRMRYLSPRSDHEIDGIWEEAAGWPLPCLYRAAVNRTDDPLLSDKLPLPDPWRPLAFGLLADSVLFGAAFWMIALLPGVALRRRRRRLGLCERCAYDLRGRGADHDVCPECGRPFTWA